MDVGDAFAVAYDRLDTGRPVPTDIEHWQSDAAAEARREAVRAAITPSATVPNALITTGTDAEIFGAALALDDMLIPAGGTLPLPTAERAQVRLRARYRRTGRLNDRQPGGVLPRRVRAGRPAAGAESLSDALDTIRVSPATWSRLAPLRVPAALDHAHHAGDPISLASLPLLADTNDIDVRSEETAAGRRVYIVTPAGAVSGRIPAAAAALPAADLALLPETTLDDAGLAAWQQALGTPGAPTWVLAGTGPVTAVRMPKGSAIAHPTSVTSSGERLRANRAVLLHGPSGHVVAVQDKQYGFTIPADLLPKYGLAAAPAESHDEGILAGRQLAVLESRAGRFAILICEDLARLAQLAPEVVEAGISHVLVPILAPPIEKHRWQQVAASQLALFGGTTVIVVNSLALGREDPSSLPAAATPADTMLTLHHTGAGYAQNADFKGNPRGTAMSPIDDALTPRVATVKAR